MFFFSLVLKGYSTEDAIHFLTTTVNDGLDSKFKFGSVFLYIFKTLDNGGICGSAIRLFASYFKDQILCCEIGGPSIDNKARCRVPNGPRLGPLLFAIYVKAVYLVLCGLHIEVGRDQRQWDPNQALLLFADDTFRMAAAKTEG